ncbi:MAG: SDR family oxidoreductase [Bifidobacteriaceae bacterium]|jgi:NAD(P)-dependent dehydrogenase (short-subunit alcohol dehydrogenase family)|nr:SDR family oxidoreductase [Bifidobacteriaceae bacterium]
MVTKAELQAKAMQMRPPLGRLDGKTALVTGSTSGIGEAIARLFAHEGAKVVVTGRNSERGLKVVEAIEDDGGQASFVKADVTVDAELRELVECSESYLGRIDILVNNAGRFIVAPLEALTLEDFDDFSALDARSYFHAMKLVIPGMEARGGGVVLNVTSLAALDPMPVFAIYGYVKAGVTQMARAVAREYAPRGVRVNNLLSGLVLTPMTDGSPDFDAVQAAVPIGRASTPMEQAYAALFLCSDEASYVTGCNMLVAGGS